MPGIKGRSGGARAGTGPLITAASIEKIIARLEHIVAKASTQKTQIGYDDAQRLFQRVTALAAKLTMMVAAAPDAPREWDGKEVL